MRYLLIFGVLLTFFATDISAQKSNKKTVWISGKVIKTNNQSSSMTIPYTHTDISKDVTDPTRERKEELLIGDTNEEIRVETTEGIYVFNRTISFVWQRRMKVKLDESVQIMVKDGFAHLKNSKGKKAKYKYFFLIPSQPKETNNENKEN